MNKIASLLMAAVCLGLTACDGFDEPNPQPQTNPQEPILTANDVVVAPSLASGSAISLTQYNDAGNGVPVLKLDSIANCPAGYSPKFVADFSAAEDYADYLTLATTVGEDGLVTVAPDALQSIFVKMFGNDPKAQTVYVRLAGYLTNGSSDVRLVSPETYYGVANYSVTPIPPSYVVEDNYYLISSDNDWDIAAGVQFKHSEKSPYDDPMFSVVVSVPVGGLQWKIVPESTYVAAKGDAYGAEPGEENPLAGELVLDGEAGVISTDGDYMITVNMIDLTYTVAEAPQLLYVIGNPAWSFDSAALLGTFDYEDYAGFAALDGEFKFTNAPDWGHTNYGSAGKEGQLSTAGDAANLEAKAGFYWCEVKPALLTYKITEVTTIGVIGDFNGWSESVAMTPSDDKQVWTATVHFTGEGGFKFRLNDDWAISLGGDLDALAWANAGNLAAPGEGDYVVTLYVGAPCFATVIEK